MACSAVGLPCPDGMECYCQPCVKAFEVEVFEYSHGRGDEHILADGSNGCDKRSLCGTVEQTKTMVFRIVDNKEREDAVVTVLVHLDETSTEIPVHKVTNESFTYEFDFSRETVGVGIIEVFVNSEQIPESPFRVQILERNCDIDYPGKGKTAVGSCASCSVRPYFACLTLLLFFLQCCSTSDCVRNMRMWLRYHRYFW